MSHYVFSVNELGLGISWTYPSKIGRCWHRPGGYVAFYGLALLSCAILVKETIGDIHLFCHPESHKNPPHYAYDAIPRTLAHPFYLSELASP